MLDRNKFRNSQRNKLSMETLERRELFAVNAFNSGLIAAQAPIANSAFVANPAIDSGRFNIGGRIGGVDGGVGGEVGPIDPAKVYEYAGNVYWRRGTDLSEKISIDPIRRLAGDPAEMNRFRVSIANMFGGIKAQGKFISLGSKEVFAYGNGGNDEIANRTSIDTNMHGGAGNDTLISGPGDDRMDGGYGNDTYGFVSNAGRGPLGSDQVIDSSGYDTLDFFALRGGVMCRQVTPSGNTSITISI